MNASPPPRVAWLLLAALLGACACQPVAPQRVGGAAARPEPRPAAQPTATDAADHATRTALSMLGAPYRYGGRSPAGFDCSGLVYYVYRNAGVRLPRTSTLQYRATSALRLDQARRGDLLFFGDGDRVSHVAIYLGGRRFVHAPSSGKAVSIASLDDPWYRDHFLRAGRLHR